MDRYDRTVGIVKLQDGTIVNQEIRTGFAWVYTSYSKNPVCLEWKRIADEAWAEKGICGRTRIRCRPGNGRGRRDT